MSTETVRARILRFARFELDPTVSDVVRPGSMPLYYSGVEVAEIDLGDGKTGVVSRAERAEGTFDPGADPVGTGLWWSSPFAFEEAVARNEHKERSIGALVSGPTITVHLEPVEMEFPASLSVFRKR